MSGWLPEKRRGKPPRPKTRVCLTSQGTSKTSTLYLHQRVLEVADVLPPIARHGASEFCNEGRLPGLDNRHGAAASFKAELGPRVHAVISSRDTGRRDGACILFKTKTLTVDGNNIA